VCVALAALLCGGQWLDRWLAERDWLAACAEADRLDPGWRWEQLRAALPALPASHDAAKHIRAISARAPKPWPDWQAAARSQGRAFDMQWRMRFSQRLYGLLPCQHLSDEQAALVRIELVRAADLIREAEGLAELPGGRPRDRIESPLWLRFGDGSFSDDTGRVNMLLHWHATLLAHDGQADAAIRACRAVVGAGRASADEPSFDCLAALADGAEPAARLAQRVLGLSEPGDEALAALQRDLSDLLARPLLRQAFRGQRAVLYDLIDSRDAGRMSREEFRLCTTGIPRSVTGVADIDELIDGCRTRHWGRRDAAALLRHLTRLVEAAPSDTDDVGGDRIQPFTAVLADYPSLPAAVRRYAQHLFIQYDDVRTWRAAVVSAVAALAAERFRRRHGRWPTGLDELIPAYLPDRPRTPFTDVPLRFRRLANGLVIYSVGPDGTDGGGEVLPTPATGTLATDIGFRLWDPVDRRQPPPGP
jgi:hypothetical protein